MINRLILIKNKFWFPNIDLLSLLNIQQKSEREVSLSANRL